MEYGILGLIVLALNLYAIYNVLTSEVSTLAKVLWTVGIFMLPVFGLIVWLVAGPRNSGYAQA